MEAQLSSETGESIPSCALDAWAMTYRKLVQDEGVTADAIAEASGFCLAMVARYALGLSSDGGKVSVLASDTPFGLCVLAGARHLQSGGAQIAVIAASSGRVSDPFVRQLALLTKRGAHTIQWNSKTNWQDLEPIIESSHNVLCGILDPENPDRSDLSEVMNNLNESVIPVHVVGCPYGVDPTSGQLTADALYASSTLSLGIPLRGTLLQHENVGRHYLCDISFGKKIYEELGYFGPPLFREQPVIKTRQT